MDPSTIQLDIHFMISAVTSAITIGISWGIKLIGSRLDKLNGTVATNQSGIHGHDVTLAKLISGCETMVATQQRTDLQIQQISNQVNHLTLNCASYHPKKRSDYQIRNKEED